MPDIFAAYGGKELPEEPTQEQAPKPAPSDPFAAYGGQEVSTAATAPEPETTPDPFAQYGGESKYNKLKKEQEAYGFFDLLSDKAAQARDGRVLTKTTSNEDIQTIAEHWGVSPDELRSIAPYFMALPPTDEASLADYAKRAVGAVGYGALGDVPQWLYKKMQDDPKMRGALDDVRDLSEGRMGAAEFVGYNLLPTPKISVATKLLARPTLGKALAKGAAVGAVYGLAGSKEGEELEGAAVGAAVGGALSGGARLYEKWRGGEVAPRAVKSSAPERDVTLDPETKRISEEYAQNNETKIAEITDQAWAHIEDSEKVIADAAINKRALTDEEVSLIVKEQMSPDTVSVMAEGKTGEEANRLAAEKLVADRREQFADALAKETPAYGAPVKEKNTERAPTTDEIMERASGAGKPEYFVDRFLGNSYVRTGQEQIAKLGVRSSPDTAPIFKLLVNGLSDRQYGLKTIDETKGSDTLLHFFNLNTNYNHMTAVQSDFDRKLSDVFKAGKKSKLIKDLDNDSGGVIYRAIEENKIDSLPAAEQEIAKKFQDQWNATKNFANNAKGENLFALNIAERTDFGAPNVLVRPVDYIIKMNQKKAEANADLLSKIGKTIEELTTDVDYKKALEESQSFRDYHGGLKFSYGEPIQNAAQLQDAAKSVARKGASNPRLHVVASTTLQREEKIPDFLREKNLFRLSKRYTSNTLRTVFLRKPLTELVNQAKLLKASGADQEAAYVERLVADNLGIRAFSMARLGNEAKIKFAEAVDASLRRLIPNEVSRKKWVDTFRVMPELMSNIQYNIYPNVLGMNPRAHVAQLTQTFFKNAPELGGTYGYELTTKGFAQAVLALRSGEARKLFYDKVREYGLEPSSFTREANEALADEMERAVSYGLPAKAIRELAQRFMYTYGKMDTFNRASTVFMAERLVSDLNKGNAGAFKAVNKMPVSVRRALVKQKGNEVEQAKVVAKYLNSVTQYNYNRPSMSEAGVILGPLFSTFTKWPLATAGDIIADLRTKGLKAGGARAIEKYGTTLLLASILDNAIRYGLGGELDVGGDFADYDERARKILGTSGFVGMTPISSATALLPGQKEKSLFTPPIVDALYNGVLAPMMTGETDRALEQGKKAVKTFAPGAFVYRFLMEDIPLYVTGEKPE